MLTNSSILNTTVVTSPQRHTYSKDTYIEFLIISILNVHKVDYAFFTLR